MFKTSNSKWFVGLKRIVEKADTSAGRSFDVVIQVLIMYSLITFSMETLPGLNSRTTSFLWWSEVIVVLIFTIEYVLRIMVADKKLKFIFSFFGLIDLLAILPFYAGARIDLRAVRVFRMVRVVRLFKLARYNRAIKRMQRAFSIVKEELIMFSVITFMILYLSAVGIYYFENEAQPEVFSSVLHSLWWAVSTLTTVGYGDAVPVTTGGKIFTFVVLTLGLGIVAVPTGLIASALTTVREEDQKGG